MSLISRPRMLFSAPTWIVGGIFLVAALDTVVINVLLGPMGDLLGGPVDYCWIASVFMLAVAVGARPAGEIFDRFGGRLVLQASAVLVGAGCALAAVASRLDQAIAARIVQGLGTAGISTACIALLGAPDDLRLRRQAQALFGGLYGLAALCGPAAAVWLTNAYGWRSVFVAMTLLSALSLRAASLLPDNSHQSTAPLHRLRFLVDAALMSGALVLCGPGHSAREAALGVLVAFAATCATIRLPDTGARRSLALGIWRLRSAAAILFVASGCLYGAVSTLAVVLHRTGISTGNIGLAVGATGGGFVVGSIISSALAVRLGYACCIGFCSALMVCALGGVAADLPIPHPDSLALLLFVMGVGFGVQNSAVLLLAQEALPVSGVGQAIAAAHLARNFGGACGINIFACLVSGPALDQFVLRDATWLFSNAAGGLAVTTVTALALGWGLRTSSADPADPEPTGQAAEQAP